MSKKILALCLVVVLAVTAVTGATLAYFTDVDQNTNEFSVGGLEIDLYETVKHTDELNNVVNGEEGTDLGKDNDTNPDFNYTDIMPGDTMKKVVTVENKENYDAYIALVIKQENYLHFNQNIDDYYENLDGYGEEAMQGIIDAVFPNWNLLYDKTQLTGTQIRYTMDTKPTAGEGVEVLGVGYAQANRDASGNRQYHYRGEYFTNVIGQKTVIDGEPNFLSISPNNEHDRVWIVYLKVEGGKSFTMDLTTVCPSYFDNNSVNAFEGMKLDVKAFAIQTQGLEPAAAFAEALKPGFGF